MICRYKIVTFLLLSLLCCEFSDEALHGPQKSNQKKQTSEDNSEAFITTVEDNGEGLNAIKIVTAPDLTKEHLPEDEDQGSEIPDDESPANLMSEGIASKLFAGVNKDENWDFIESDVPDLFQTVQKFFMWNQKTGLDMLKRSDQLDEISAKKLLGWLSLYGTEVTPQDFAIANAYLTPVAEVGDKDGHLGLGLINALGFGVNVSQARALVHYKMAAISGDIYSNMILGYRYWSGVTVASSCEKALEYYSFVASIVTSRITFGGGMAIQRIRLLDELENGHSSGIVDNDLIEYYQLLAEKGDIQAQVGLGQLHYQGGRGVDLDYEKAKYYFSLAATTGNAIAMAYIGKIYLEGKGKVQRDYEQALAYFKKAADLNNPVGQSGMGYMYLKGKGVEKDYVKAMKFLTLAADQGWVDGQLYLGIMYFKGLGTNKDFKQANKYFSLASQSGHVLAYYHLALMHEHGQGVMRSCTTAVELYKNVAERSSASGKALMNAHKKYRNNKFNEAFVAYAILGEMGYEVAQSNAAFMLDRGEVPMMSQLESHIRALQYWGRAAAQGYSPAQVKLGDYHYYGWGTPVDYETAASHYRHASEQQHNAQAMFNLGYMHEQGLGMDKDMHLAKRCYDLAAETNADAKVPVALALLKLNIMFSMQSLQQYFIEGSIFTDFSDALGSNWDLYLITTLTAILAGVIYFRRPQRVVVE